MVSDVEAAGDLPSWLCYPCTFCRDTQKLEIHQKHEATILHLKFLFWMLLPFQSSFLQSTMCLCSKPGKAILQLLESGLHLSQKSTDFLHILNLFISFDHLIPGKSNQASSLSTFFWKCHELNLEYQHAWQMLLSLIYSSRPTFPL